MAENNNVIGLAMQLDVTDIKTGIKEVNKTIKSAKDEFTNATAGMDMWSKSSEGLNAKLSQLGKQLNAQQKAVSGYEAEIERVKNLEGDHSTELEKLNEKLQKAKNAVKNTQSQMSHYGDSLKAVQRQEKDANSALGKLTQTIEDQKKELGDLTKDYKAAVIQYGKNSDEAKNLAKQIKDLSGEIEDNEAKVKKADDAFDGLSRSFEDVGTAALGKAVKGLAKVGAAVAGVVGSFLATAEATRELRTNMGKVDTAFKESGFTAEQAEETYKKFYGVLGDEGQATEAVSHLAKLANSQEDLAKWTDIAAGVYGTFGDSLPIENLTEAANETAKTGELTGGLADALNWVGISEDKFQDKLDACSTEQERQKLITDTLTKSYGEASKQYQETNKDIIASQEAQAELSQAMADIGARAEPLMTAMKEMGTQILQALLPVIDAVIPFVQDHLPAFAIAAGAVTAAVGTLAAAVGVLKLKTELATVATVAKTAAEKAAALATKGVTAAQWLLNAALSANPIGIVIVAITALVAAFVVLWKKSDSFRNFWKKLWEDIKKYAKVAIDAIAKFFSACWDGIKKAWNGAGKFFSGIWKNIKDAFKDTTKWFSDKFKKAWDGVKSAFGKVGDFFKGVYDDVVSAFKSIPESLKGFFTKAWDKIKSAFNNVGKFFSGIAGDVVDGFKSLPDKMKTVGKNLIEGLWKGVSDMASWISGKLKGFSDNVLGGIKKFFGVHSPSTKMAEIGGYMAEGLANGLEEGTKGVVEAGTEAGNAFGDSFNATATNALNKGSSKISDSFGSLTKKIEHQKSKLTNLESEYKSAVMTFGETSKEAYSVGRQIIQLSKELEENELKVKNLDDSYQNLNGTLANQMRVELNNTKNSKKALEEQKAELDKLYNAAGRAQDYKAAEAYSMQIGEINNKLNSVNSTIKELTSNLDYMSELENKAASSASTTVKEVEKEKNAYEKLVATIEEQKKQLEQLKTEYGSAIIQFGEQSNEANNLAEQIRNVTEELKANEKQVATLNAAYENLNAQSTTITVTIDDRNAWEKFIDNCEKALGLSESKLKQWSNKAGKYVSKVEKALSSIASKAGEFSQLMLEAMNIKTDAQIDAIDKALDRITKQTETKLDQIESTKNAEIAAIEETKNAEIAAVEERKNADLAAIEERKNARLEAFNASFEEETENHTNMINEELANLNLLYDNEEISSAEYRARKRALEEELTLYKKQKEDEKFAYQQQVEQEELAAQELANQEALQKEKALNDKLAAEKQKLEDEKLAAEEAARKAQEAAEKKATIEKNKLAKKQFDAEKRNSILEAGIQGALAIVKGFAQLGPIAGAIAAVAQAAITAAQIAVISSKQYVPMMAKGGVVDSATLAVIGENGKEAVMPLENNTGWINELANKISEILQKDMVGGLQAMQPAYAMNNGAQVINNNYYQTINSPKQLTRREIYRDSKNLLALKG